MFTAYYILAVGFGVFACVMSAIGLSRLKSGADFPGKASGAIMAVAALIAVGTLAAVIHGGNQEVKKRKEEGKKSTPTVQVPDSRTTRS